MIAQVWPQAQPETSMAAQCGNCGVLNMLWFDPEWPTSTYLREQVQVPNCLVCGCSLKYGVVVPVPR